MAKPILYMAEISPAVRVVLMVAKAINLELEHRIVNLTAGEHLKPNFLKLNPQHTVPTLDDNGHIIWDSAAISTYLIEKYAKDDSLYPKDLYTRARINQRLQFNNGVLFAKTRPLSEAVFHKGATDFPPETLRYIIESYDFMEAFLKTDLYMVGNKLTVADLSCVSTISIKQIAVPIDSLKYPKLLAWYERMKQIPFYAEINDKRVEMFKAFIFGKLEANRIAAANK